MIAGRTATPKEAGVGHRRLAKALRTLILCAGWITFTAFSAVRTPEHGAASTRRPGPPLPHDTPRLPDLRTLPPSDLRLVVGPDGSRRLRLANTVWNAGQGPLELRGAPSAVAGQLEVFQVVYAADGTSLERPVGHFRYHPTHAHWHLDDFALYQLWSLAPNGDLDKIVAGGSKVSYCLIDTDIVRSSSEGFVDQRQYRGCGRLRQGLSDHYHAGLDGQELHLGDLPDGIYALVSTANIDGRLLETDPTNNTALVYLALAGRRVTVLPARVITREACLTNGFC
jgi:hypothetical protein